MSTSRNWNALRLVEGRLAWYRPDSDGAPAFLDDDQQRKRLLELVQSRQAPVCFAAPATAVRLQRLQISAEEKKHLAKSLPFMLEEQLAQDVDSLTHTPASLPSRLS